MPMDVHDASIVEPHGPRGVHIQRVKSCGGVVHPELRVLAPQWEKLAVAGEKITESVYRTLPQDQCVGPEPGRIAPGQLPSVVHPHQADRQRRPRGGPCLAIDEVPSHEPAVVVERLAQFAPGGTQGGEDLDLGPLHLAGESTPLRSSTGPTAGVLASASPRRAPLMTQRA